MTQKPEQNQDWSAGYIAGTRDSEAHGTSGALVAIAALLLLGILIGWMLSYMLVH